MQNTDKIKNVLDKLIELGYTSHDNDNCGLHFHVTRPENPEVIDRLWLILETYKRQIIELSRRTGGQISHWAQFLSDFINNDAEQLKALYFIKKTNKNRVRYMALNNQNEKTIEFRFFRGTLKSETFFACIEFINNLMTLCSNLDINIESITWDKLCKGKYITNYIKEKGIFANFAPVDNSLEYIKKENAEKILINKINRLLMQQARAFLNTQPAPKTNLKTLDDFCNNINTMSNYYRDLRDGYFENLYFLKDYTESHNVRDYCGRLTYVLNHYNNYKITPELAEKINGHFEKLKKLENIGG